MSGKAQTNAKTTTAPVPSPFALPARPFAAAPAPAHAAPDLETAARLGHRFSAIDVRRARLIVQPKLTLGPANDKYEQEADRVAAQVVSGIAAPVRQRQPLALMRRMAAAPTPGVIVPPGVEMGIAAARGGGQPLPSEVRGQMEEALGADF